MSFKGIFHEMKGGLQLFFFCLIFFMSAIFGSLIVLTVVGDIWVSTSSIRMAQTIQAAAIFLLPALIFAYLFNPKPKLYLKVDTPQNLQTISLVVLLMVAIQPFIYLMSYYNEQLVLPESMVALDRWIKEGEQMAEKSLRLFLVDKSVISFILNFFTIAIIAALVEEVFFRGCLQQIIQKIVSNKHIAIWITAIIFSAIHFQFYGFIPRLLLGAVLGYLFVWSGSLWVPVIAHTVHNAINITLLQIYFGTPEFEKMENLNINNHLWLAILSMLLAIILLFFIKKNKTKEQIV